eukprot:719234-Karenia_brevis.AAC.1
MVPGEDCKKEMFQRISEKIKDSPAQWETRGSGINYQKPLVPAEVSNKTLKEKLDIYVEGMPPNMDSASMAKMLLHMCT